MAGVIISVGCQVELCMPVKHAAVWSDFLLGLAQNCHFLVAVHFLTLRTVGDVNAPYNYYILCTVLSVWLLQMNNCHCLWPGNILF
jgi:hypothetical protein